jgi:hypothetical protein
MGTLTKVTTNLATELLVRAGPSLAKVGLLRKAAILAVETHARQGFEKSRATSHHPPGVDEDRMLMGLALAHTIERILAERRASQAVRRTLFETLVQGLMFEQAGAETKARFNAQYGGNPPGFLVISPGKACNLRCTGCYADSGPTAEKLDWGTLDRIVTEATDPCGAHGFSLSVAASRWPTAPTARASSTWLRNTATASS